MAVISLNKGDLSVDSKDGIGCVAVWLEVWLTPA